MRVRSPLPTSTASLVVVGAAVASVWGGWGVRFSTPSATLSLAGLSASGSFSSAPVGCAGVSMYPSPGTRTASTETQISLRGLAPARIAAARISVRGSSTGEHTTRLVADSDNRGASLFPEAPFSPGETVTVTAPFAICGAGGDTASFQVARPAPPIPASAAGGGRQQAATPASQLQHFQSAPSLEPPALTVTASDPSGEGDLFLNPKGGTSAGGPMIIDGSGHLVWFDPLPLGVNSSDLRVESLAGQPVLTWWQGAIITGHGRGADVIMNDHYQVIDVVTAGNGYAADLHEFLLGPGRTAWLTAYSEVGWDLRSIGGPADGAIWDGVVQEIDIPTGNVLFEWHSLDHVPPTLSVLAYPGEAAGPFDYFHVNSIDPSGHGTVLISSRHTDAVFLVDVRSGAILWTLGGKASSFVMGPDTRFALQHDGRLRGTSTVTIFDDEADGRPARLIAIHLDLARRTASLVWSDTGPDELAVLAQGNFQPLADGNVVSGWGSGAGSPVMETTASGRVIFAATFVPAGINSYRAYREAWSAVPAAPPATAVRTSGSGLEVDASWNGATGVAEWTLLGGPTPSTLRPLASVPDTGFETALHTAAQPQYVSVEAVSATGAVLASTQPQSVVAAP